MKAFRKAHAHDDVAVADDAAAGDTVPGSISLNVSELNCARRVTAAAPRHRRRASAGRGRDQRRVAKLLRDELVEALAECDKERILRLRPRFSAAGAGGGGGNGDGDGDGAPPASSRNSTLRAAGQRTRGATASGVATCAGAPHQFGDCVMFALG